jgi:ubiquinone/menaquinone biosynthesis C-methylase UbiE
MPDFKKIKPKEKNPDTSWNGVASWYDDLLENGSDTYQASLILPNVLRLLNLKKGDKVIDVACGQGFFSREFFKAGAIVTGIDLSPKLIDLAKERSPKEIRFAVSSADNIRFLENGSFDAAACVLAIQNIKNAAGVFAECARLLKPAGRLVMVMNHPAFRVPGHSEWGVDMKKRIQYRRVDEYISESESEVKMHPGIESSEVTISFHRPLQFYFKALAKSGFSVSRLEEWTSNKQSQPGPNSNMENKARKEFPLFLALEAVKMSNDL